MCIYMYIHISICYVSTYMYTYMYNTFQNSCTDRLNKLTDGRGCQSHKGYLKT